MWRSSWPRAMQTNEKAGADSGAKQILKKPKFIGFAGGCHHSATVAAARSMAKRKFAFFIFCAWLLLAMK